MAGCCLCFLWKIKMRSHYSSSYLPLKTEFKKVDCLPLRCFYHLQFIYIFTFFFSTNNIFYEIITLSLVLTTEDSIDIMSVVSAIIFVFTITPYNVK